jgi:hypothetical protein
MRFRSPVQGTNDLFELKSWEPLETLQRVRRGGKAPGWSFFEMSSL